MRFIIEFQGKQLYITLDWNHISKLIYNDKYELPSRGLTKLEVTVSPMGSQSGPAFNVQSSTRCHYHDHFSKSKGRQITLKRILNRAISFRKHVNEIMGRSLNEDEHKKLRGLIWFEYFKRVNDGPNYKKETSEEHSIQS